MSVAGDIADCSKPQVASEQPLGECFRPWHRQWPRHSSVLGRSTGSRIWFLGACLRWPD